MCHCFHFFPSICHEVMGPDAMISVFFILSFKLAFSLSFTLIKRFCSCSLLYVIRMVSSTHLRLLIFLLAILIPACNSSSPAFLIMCSVYKLNKQGDNKNSLVILFCQSWTSCSIQDSNCCFLTHTQVSQETGEMVWYSHLFVFHFSSFLSYL